MLPILLGSVTGLDYTEGRRVDIDLDNQIMLAFLITTYPLTSWIYSNLEMCYRRAVGIISGPLQICAQLQSQTGSGLG